MQVRGPFLIIDHPYADQDYAALIDVYDHVGNDFTKVDGATVTLNGVALPHYASNGFTTRGATGVTIAPGTSLEIVASHDAARATLAFACRGDLVLTAPAEGTAVAAGEPLTVAWTGALGTDNAGEPPTIVVEPYDSVHNRTSFDPSAPRTRIQLDGRSSTVTVNLPPATAGYDGYAVTLSNPGRPAPVPADIGGEPWCTSWLRVHLTSK
jgi:hypothetical protein